MRGMPSSHFTIGSLGEATAESYLRSHGYRIIARNARIGAHGEIDIVAEDLKDGVSVFVEVKSRARAEGLFDPFINVHHIKRRRLARAARWWMVDHKLDGGYRIDVITVANGAVIDHIQEIRTND